MCNVRSPTSVEGLGLNMVIIVVLSHDLTDNGFRHYISYKVWFTNFILIMSWLLYVNNTAGCFKNCSY